MPRPTDTTTAIDVEALERKHDSSLQTRATGKYLGMAIAAFSLFFALYHYVTAGTGVPVDHWHMGIHLAGVLSLIFFTFPMLRGTEQDQQIIASRWRFQNVPCHDWILVLLGICSSLYLGTTWEGIDLRFIHESWLLAEQSERQGNIADSDVVAGTVLIIVVLEAVRRTLGIVIPIIIGIFIFYAVAGPHLPIDILKHPGLSWRLFINQMYFPQEGIFGVTLWIVSTVVFHFVLFGIVAQRMGLGQFFVNIATVLAGRYTGGLAKVSVVSSAFFGTISGSSIANTVSTGSLTIPNMKKMGYPAHLAGAVEAASSAGGQITPPIMGAAAFVMAEFLEVSYTTILLAAMVPAAMHYLGVFTIVHFHAKRLGLKGVPVEDIPRLWDVIRDGWPTVTPLIVLIYVLFSGFTPYMAAFWGITTALAVGILNPMHRIKLIDLYEAALIGVKYALAVGAVCAAIGIIVGTVNSTGLGFRLGFLVASGALSLSEVMLPLLNFLPLISIETTQMTLFLSLVLIGITCILMGAGLPTTALYIMLVTVAQPTLANLGIPALASHLFVLYYGVISEITPPVCASAYAAASIAGSDPLKTGISAFSLGIGKLVVPMVFVYSPAMLIVLDDYFTWSEFLLTTLTCAGGIGVLGVAITGYFPAPTPAPVLMRLLAGSSGVLLVTPGLNSDLWGGGLLLLLLAQQAISMRGEPVRQTGLSGGSAEIS